MSKKNTKLNKMSFRYVTNFAVATSACISTFSAAYAAANSPLTASSQACQNNNLANELVNKQETDFIKTLSNASADCVSKLIQISSDKNLELIKSIFSNEKISLVTRELKNEIEKLDQNNLNNIYNYSNYLNIGLFLRSEYKINQIRDNFENNPEFKNNIAYIADEYARKIFRFQASEKLKNVSKQVFALISSAKTYEESIPLMEYITKNSRSISKDNPLYEAILPIQKVLSASHSAQGIFFSSDANKTKFKEIIENIIKIVRTINSNSSASFEDLDNNYIRVLGEFLHYKPQNNVTQPKNAFLSEYNTKIIDTLKTLIGKEHRKVKNGDNWQEDPTPYYVSAVNALYNNDIVHLVDDPKCKEFKDKNGHDICNAIADFSKSQFPSKNYFDEGNIAIFSSLKNNEANAQYNAMKQVEALFKRTTQTLKPVKGDKNQRLQVVIYKTHADYMKFKSTISRLSNKDDGGIYIESQGTFYTYAGPGLEDRVRHEYAHYLVGRYLVTGSFGDTSLYSKWDRMTWFEEGFAEFFAGATHSNGFLDRKNKYDRIDINEIQPIEAITKASYGTTDLNVLYNQGYALVSFLYENKLNDFNKIIAAVKSNSGKNFDEVVKEFATSKYDEEFKAYIISKKNSNLLKNPSTSYYSSSNPFKVTDLNTIQSEIKNSGLNIEKCEVVASSAYINSQARFGCTGIIDSSNSDFNQSNVLLNNALKLLSSDSNNYKNNFKYTNCMFGEMKNNSRTVYCEGPLESANFSDLSTEKQEQVKENNTQQRAKTFKNSNEHWYFFTGDMVSNTWYENHRRQEALNYKYKNNDPSRGSLNTGSDGSFTYKNTGTSDEDYKPIDATVNIGERVGSEVPLVNKDPFNINAKVVKFKDTDERMFASTIHLDEKGSYRGYLYVNESTGAIRFDDEFRGKAVTDFKFEIAKCPEGAFCGISGYSFGYDRTNPNLKDEIIEVKVSKYDWEPKIIKIKVESYDSNKNNELIKLANSSNLKTIEKEINITENSRGYVYTNIVHLLGEGHFNYEIIEKAKCGNFRVNNSGSYVYDNNDTCPAGTPDEVTLLASKVEIGMDKQLTPKSYVKIKILR